MTTPTLSITIPTYNRQPFLQETLEILLPQVTDEVEIVVFDNCSTDDTEEYVRSLEGKVAYFRQESNLGPDRNMFTCLSQAQGEYVWLLCDDDRPCSNAVPNILAAIHTYDKPPLIYLRVIPADKEISSYDPAPVETGWKLLNSNEFLSEVSFFLTFAPLIVVRRECFDKEFVEKSVGTFHVPAAVVLSTVGRYGQALLVDKPLLYGRLGNQGGYNFMRVFTHNLIKLFQRCPRDWFDRRVLDKIYNENIAVLVNPVLRRRPSVARLWIVVRNTYRYPNLYYIVIPAMLWLATKKYLLRRR